MSTTEEPKTPPPTKLFKFPSHQSHMVSLAKMCRDSNQFADCIIQCEEGAQVRGHKLVLGSASKFLKDIFKVCIDISDEYFFLSRISQVTNMLFINFD